MKIPFSKTSICLFFLGMLLTVPFVDRYYAYTFEADALATVTACAEYYDAFRYGAFDELSRPGSHPPYLDGQYFVYVLTVIPLKIGKVLFGLDELFPSQQSYIIAGVAWGSALAHVFTVFPLLFLARRIGADRKTEIITALLYFVSPVMLSIGFMRVDHVMLAGFVGLLASTVLWLEQDSWWHRLLLGFCAGFLMTTKLTALFYLFPVFAGFVYVQLKEQNRIEGIAWACGIGLVTGVLLSFRYVMFFDELWLLAMEKVEGLQRWYHALGVREPYLYYHWDAYQNMSALFVVAALMGVVVLVMRWRERPLAILFVLLSFALLSFQLITTYKYERGGYLLFPLYLLPASACLTYLFKSRTLAAKWVAWGSAVCIGLYSVAGSFQIAVQSQKRGEVIHITRTLPREWMETNLKPGARVAYLIHSTWALPPLDGLDIVADPGPFRLPYLQPDEMRAFPVPTLEEVREQADIVLINDFHMDDMFTLRLGEHYGQPEKAKAWLDLMKTMRTLPESKSFQADGTAYLVGRVDICVLNPEILQTKPR